MPRTHISMGDAGITPRSVTRRDALRLFMGAGVCATFFPAVARAETTQEKLDAAQMSFEDAQAELDRIGQETAEVAGRLSETQVQISELNAQIDQTQADIESKQGEIDERQAQIEEKQKRRAHDVRLQVGHAGHARPHPLGDDLRRAHEQHLLPRQGERVRARDDR